MTNFLSKSYSKIFLFLTAIIFTVVFFNLPFIFKEEFSNIKNIIERDTSKALDKKVKIEKIGFLPYGELILYNVKIYDRTGNTLYADIKRCNIQFKLLPFFLNRLIIVNRVAFREPALFFPLEDFKIPQKDKIEGFSHYKLVFSKDFLINVTSGRAVLEKTNFILDEVGFAFWARLVRGRVLYSEGRVDLKDFSLEEYILSNFFFPELVNKIGYKLKVTVLENNLSVDEMLLDFGQFKLGVDGVVGNYKKDPVVDLKMSLRDLLFSENISLKSKLFVTTIRNIFMQIKGALKEPRLFISLDFLRSKFATLPAVLKMDNFYCDLKLTKNEVIIEECSCFLNNFPVGLNFRLSGGEFPKIEFALRSYPGQIQSLRQFNRLNFDFSFSGQKWDSKVKGRVSFEMEKLLSSSPRKVSSLKVSAEDLLCRFSDDKINADGNKAIASLVVEGKGLVYESDMLGRDLRLDIAEFSSLVYPEKDKFYVSDLNVFAYEGALKGNGFLDFSTLPPRRFLDFEVDRLSVEELVNILDLDYDITGSLVAEGAFDSKAPSYLAGEANISNGHIGEMKLLDLISDFLNVVSLKDIYFEDLSSDFSFSIAREKITFDNLSLHSKDIYLTSSLTLDNKQRLKGFISVRLSTELLKESFKLRLLLFLMGERLPYVDFDFEIGGLLGNPHIKWLDTKFKEKLVRYLSERGQKAMEEEIEKAMEPLFAD